MFLLEIIIQDKKQKVQKLFDKNACIFLIQNKKNRFKKKHFLSPDIDVITEVV